MTWSKEQREKWIANNPEAHKKKNREYQTRKRRALGIPERVRNVSPLRAKILEIRKTLKMKGKKCE